jgi:hypothetical protein
VSDNLAPPLAEWSAWHATVTPDAAENAIEIVTVAGAQTSDPAGIFADNGHTPEFALLPGIAYAETWHVKGEPGHTLYVQANFYESDWTWIEAAVTPIVANGEWQTVEKSYLVPAGTVNADTGLYMETLHEPAQTATLVAGQSIVYRFSTPDCLIPD